MVFVKRHGISATVSCMNIGGPYLSHTEHPRMIFMDVMVVEFACDVLCRLIVPQFWLEPSLFTHYNIAYE